MSDPQERTWYGPRAPEEEFNHTDLRTPAYLRGFARKARADLERVARLYSGKRARLFKIASRERCPECTDILTGERVRSTCSSCDGTGFVYGYEQHGDHWILMDIPPTLRMDSRFGTLEGQGRKDGITFIGEPLLRDRDILALLDTQDLYRVNEEEPFITSVQGIVVTQTVRCSYIPSGAMEYSLLDLL